MSALVSGSGGSNWGIVLVITGGRLDRKSLESLKADIEKLARRYRLRVRKLKLENAAIRAKKTKKKK